MSRSLPLVLLVAAIAIGAWAPGVVAEDLDGEPGECDDVDVAVEEDTCGTVASASVRGDARGEGCEGLDTCVTVSGTGDAMNTGGEASCGRTAHVRMGDSALLEVGAGCLAASGTGNASNEAGDRSCSAAFVTAVVSCLAVSGTGDASNRAGDRSCGTLFSAGISCVSISGTGNASNRAGDLSCFLSAGCLSVSGTGHAEANNWYGVAVSGTGSTEGQTALDARTLETLVATTIHTPEEDENDRSTDRAWPEPDEATLRPGIAIGNLDVPVGDTSCTANFVFSSRTDDRLFIGTAAHCVGARGERVELAHGTAHGTVAYNGQDVFEQVEEDDICATEQAQDFALIEIPEAFWNEVHPKMLGWGGPTDLRTQTRSGEQIYRYGNSTLRNGAHNAGTGYAMGNSPCSTQTASLGISGDSGSPVLASDGAAVGVHVGPGGEFVNLAQAVAFAERHTDLSVALETWSWSGLDESQAAPLPPGARVPPVLPTEH